MADNAEVVERRCLYCKSTRANALFGERGWFYFDVKTGRIGPFCTQDHMQQFAAWSTERQLDRIYGEFEKAEQFIAALEKGTCLADAPTLYPRQIEGQGDLLVGPGETYVIGWAGGSFAGESFPTFEGTPYEAKA